jgi:hypothetical protein
VYVFAARTGRPVGKPFTGAAGFVVTVSFNPITDILASTGSDGSGTMADPVTGASFGSTLRGGTHGFSTGAWDPSGRRFVILANNGHADAWDMFPRDWERRACETAGRTLTREEWNQFLPDQPYDPAC